MARRAFGKRWPIIATAAVVLVAAGGATAVFLVGSAQRRDDRRAYLAYERAALVPIREGGQIVQEEMKPSLAQLHNGNVTVTDALTRASGWRNVLRSELTTLLALRPPSFLEDIDAKWTASFDAYVSIADLFAQAARASGPERDRLLDAAAAAGTRADSLFDAAARVMQFHRRRLGLGPTHSLPDPASTGS